MKNIVRFFIISLALFGSCFAAKNGVEKAKLKKVFEKLSNDSLGNSFSILKPKNIAQLQRTSKEFKKVSERVYKNVPLETVHNIMQEKNGHDILKLYNHAKSLERNESFERTNQKDETIANTYTLALVTQNKKVKEKLSSEYNNLLKQKNEIEKNLFFNKIFKWAGKHNFFNNTPEQTLAIISDFNSRCHCEFLKVYFEAKSLKEKESFELINEAAESIARAYILARATQNDTIIKKLKSAYNTHILQKNNREQSRFYNRTFSWATTHNFLQSPKIAEEIISDLHELFNNPLLNLYFEVKNNQPFNKNSNQIGMAYILALQTENKEIQETLEKEDGLASSVLGSLYTAGRYNFLQTNQHAKKIISMLHTCSNDEQVNAFERATQSNLKKIVNKMFAIPGLINKIPANTKGTILEDVIDKKYKNFIKKMLNSPEFMNGISADDREECFGSAIGRRLEKYVIQMLRSPEFMNDFEESAKWILFEDAAQFGLTKVLKEMFEHKEYIHYCTINNKINALRYAARYFRFETVQFLLDKIQFELSSTKAFCIGQALEELSIGFESESGKKMKTLLQEKLDSLNN